MKAVLMTAGACVLGLSVTLRADTHVYSANSDGTWSKVGRLSTADGERSVVCVDGDCISGGSFCGPCHQQAVDTKQYTSEAQRRHWSRYLPQSAVSVAEGQKVTIGRFQITRKAGVLELLDAGARRFRLPPEALLVKGRNGAPALVVYGSAQAPQLVR